MRLRPGHSNWAAVALVLAILATSSTRHCMCQTVGKQDIFTEEAVVSPLPDGRVLVHFHFSLTAPHRRHCTLFPLSISQLAAAVPFDAVELSLTQGRWHYHRWGQPLIPLKPAGAELQATFSPKNTQTALPSLWSTVSHALGGLFCASLHFVARPQSTAVQAITARRTTVQQDGVSRAAWRPAAAGSHVLYAALPQEASCTENLTPWLKLLPCRDAAGLGELLKRRDVLFGAEYHSLRVSLKIHRDADLQPLYSNLTQTLTLVLDPSNKNIIKPSGRSLKSGITEFELATLMGSSLQSVCPAARASRLYVLLPGQVPAGLLQGLVQIPRCPAGKATDSISSKNSSSKELQAEDKAALIGDNGASNLRNNDQENIDRPARCCRAAKGTFTTQVGLSLQPSPDAAVITPSVASSLHGVVNSAAKANPEEFMAAQSHSKDSIHHVMYMYDLQPIQLQRKDPARNHRSFVEDNTAPHASLLPLKVTIAQDTEQNEQKGSVQRVQPTYTVDRYITGNGNLHGGMVLGLCATDRSVKTTKKAGDVGVCIFQVVPWYVRLWLHTLQLTLDGKVVPLSQHLLARHITTAQDRARPLVLNLCLRLPAAAQHITLSAKFSKAFLTAFEHPPDAQRGFDVPAAQITYLGPVPIESATADPAARTTASIDAVQGVGGVGWGIVDSRQQQIGDSIVMQANEQTALLQTLAEPRPEQVYSPGLVVPLAVPDFSMPYNVICLTSTVLAVFTGATLNALLERPGREQRMLAEGAEARKAERRKKKLKLLLVMALFVVFGLYVDPSLQETVVEQLKAAGLLDR